VIAEKIEALAGGIEVTVASLAEDPTERFARQQRT
jgi:hypothetical protein